MKKQTGVTFIEVIVTMVVVIILASLTRPIFLDLIAKQRAKARTDSIYQDLNYARQLALTYQNSVTTCPLDQQQRCTNQWQNGYTVFIDSSPFGEFNDGDERLFQRQPIHSSDHIKASRSQVRFSPSGFTGNTGSIRYCPLTTDSELRMQITVSSTGGIRYNNQPNQC